MRPRPARRTCTWRSTTSCLSSARCATASMSAAEQQSSRHRWQQAPPVQRPASNQRRPTFGVRLAPGERMRLMCVHARALSVGLRRSSRAFSGNGAPARRCRQCARLLRQNPWLRGGPAARSRWRWPRRTPRRVARQAPAPDRATSVVIRTVLFCGAARLKLGWKSRRSFEGVGRPG